MLPQLKLGMAALSEGSPRRAASVGNRRTENRQDERVGSKYCSWWQPSLGLHRLAPLVSNRAARAALRGLLVGLCRPLESLWAGEGEELSRLWVKLHQILVHRLLWGFFHPAPRSQRAKSGDPEMLLGPQGLCRVSSSTGSCTVQDLPPCHLHEVPLGGFGVISTRTAQTSNSRAGKTPCYCTVAELHIWGDLSFSWLCWAVIPLSMPQFPLPPLPSSLERALPCTNTGDPLQDAWLQPPAEEGIYGKSEARGGYSF